ncbi:MAG: hypothetical protein JRI68_31285 [Deltaproteobacteria bacterium]|nr:hypothetical protein [Deltaproteobacteria bacterium]
MTAKPRPWNKLPVALLLATIGLVLPVDGYLAQDKVKLPGRPASKKVREIEREEWFDGRAGTKLERKLMNESYVGRWLTAHHNELSYRLLRRTSPASWVGRDDWLFIPQRVRDLRPREWEDLVRFDVAAIVEMNRRVARSGARLVVALVPDRARIYPDKAYPTGTLPPGKAGFLPAMQAALTAQGVVAVDLTEAMAARRAAGEQVFYSDDHHWTSTGAKAAAQGIVAALPPELREIVRGKEQRPHYRETWKAKGKHRSSITVKLGFVPNGELENSFKVPQPRVRQRGKKVKGFAESCATYWSTSYGLYGSPQFFANEVRCPVRILMKAGAGSSWAPLRDLPKVARAGGLEGRHLVIWEIPEYHLVDVGGKMPSAFDAIRQRFAKRKP